MYTGKIWTSPPSYWIEFNPTVPYGIGNSCMSIRQEVSTYSESQAQAAHKCNILQMGIASSTAWFTFWSIPGLFECVPGRL